MLIDQHQDNMLGYYFPTARREIDAFRQSFCPTRLPQAKIIPPQIHIFHQRASIHNMASKITRLNLFAENKKYFEAMVEHVVLAVDDADEVLATIPIREKSDLRPIDCLRGIRAERVRYLCSVRRRRLTMFRMMRTPTLSELSIGILFRPRKGFEVYAFSLFPTVPPPRP